MRGGDGSVHIVGDDRAGRGDKLRGRSVTVCAWIREDRNAQMVRYTSGGKKRELNAHDGRG